MSLATIPPGVPHRFFVEFDTDEVCPFPFTDDPVVILFFASWAFSADFGGQHELGDAAMHLKRRLNVDLKPILKYADRDFESELDRRELERSWQPSIALAACVREIAAHLEAPDETLAPLIAGYEHLAPRLRELAAMCDWAATRNARVRMTFDLREPDERRRTPRTVEPR